MEIELGNGQIEICPVEKDGRHGLLLKKHTAQHGIGEPTRITGPVDDFNSQTDVIIWFGSLESARVFQDGVSLALMRMQGFEGGEYQ